MPSEHHRFHIETLNAEQAAAAQPALIDILYDAVESGASIGFVLPLERTVAQAYWQDVIERVAAGTRLLLVARQNTRIVGTVQLELVQRPNSSHRAEVQKLLVLRAARRQGLGRALLVAVEQAARAHGRNLLVLDTRRGDGAEQLYREHGYIEVGIIPDYACDPDGTLAACVFFYRRL